MCRHDDVPIPHDATPRTFGASWIYIWIPTQIPGRSHPVPHDTPRHEDKYTPNVKEWERTVYGEPFEELPEDMPVPKGKIVRQSAWFDANLQHDLVTGRSAMGSFHMVQGTPIHSSSKRQNTVETATNATEFIAGQTCLDEAVAIRYELRMLGAPLDGPMWMFGDNKSMINSSSEPSGRRAKRHLILSWHRLREKAAMKIVYYLYTPSEENFSDCLTKHLTHAPLWHLIKDLLFHRYNENEVIEVLHYLQMIEAAPDGECQAGNGFGPDRLCLGIHSGAVVLVKALMTQANQSTI
jgi:hypothetical protein